MKYKKAPRCRKTMKARFPNERLAGRAMMRIWSHDTEADIYDLHTYQCEHCKGWHVGHKSYYEKELAKQQAASVPA